MHFWVYRYGHAVEHQTNDRGDSGLIPLQFQSSPTAYDVLRKRLRGGGTSMSMPREVKDPTQGVNGGICSALSALNNSSSDW